MSLFDICIYYSMERTSKLSLSNKTIVNTYTIEQLCANSFAREEFIDRQKGGNLFNALQPLKCVCFNSNFETKLQDKLHGEKLITEYYISRRENSVPSGKISLNKLASLFKLAENLNFLR